MPYNPPHITPGQVPTGADINTWLTGIVNPSANIDPEDLDPDARFDAAAFVQTGTVDHVNVAGLGDQNAGAGGLYGVGKTRTFYAETDGRLDAINARHLPTNSAGSLTVLRNDVQVAVGATFARDDKIEIIAETGVVGCARFIWRMVGP